MKFNLVRDDESANLTVYLDGQVLNASESHPNFAVIEDWVLTGVLPGEEEEFVELFDIATTVSNHFEKLTERVSVSNGVVYFDNEVVENVVTKQILRLLNDREDFLPVVNFLEKVKTNPNQSSVDGLYSWLSAHDFTLTDDGDFLAYKGVQSDSKGGYQSLNTGRAIVNGVVHNGYIPNAVGDVVEMPRSEVDSNPYSSCSTGLHVGTYNYAKSYSSNGVMLLVKVNPRDAVAVPNGEAEKMRTCRYTVVEIVDAPVDKPVVKTGKSGPVRDAKGRFVSTKKRVQKRDSNGRFVKGWK